MKKLYINENPEIKSLQFNAFAESIISIHKSHKDWLANNYIQLLVHYSYEDAGIINYLSGNILGSLPLLNINVTSKSEVIGRAGILHYIISNIDANNYVYMLLDEFYIPHRPMYGKKHFMHDELFYGYDLKKELLFLIGYDDQGLYRGHSVSFEQFWQSYSEDDGEWLHQIALTDFDYKFNKKSFLDMVTDYYDAKFHREKLDLYLDMKTYNKHFYDERLKNVEYYGIRVYDALYDSIQRRIANKRKLNIRDFYIVYEHKSSILYSLNYLEENHMVSDLSSIKEKMNEIKKESKTMLNLCIKHNIVNSIQLVDNIYERIEKIKVLEKNTIYELIDKLT